MTCLLGCVFSAPTAARADAALPLQNQSAAMAPAAAASAVDPFAKIAVEVARGAALLEANDETAIEVLRGAAQQSLLALVTQGGPAILTTAPDKLPATGPLAVSLNKAAQAHYQWGRAAYRFGRRDEAITALARAARLAGDVRFGSNTLARDALLELRVTLKEGLPLLAPDDTIDTVASLAHFNLWKPYRFRFDYSNVPLQPTFAPSAIGAPGAAQSTLGNTAGKVAELLMTVGTLFPPEPVEAAQTSADKVVVPPLYRAVPPDKLPNVLKLGKMVAGYARETSGPHRGLWRQVVRVFYAHPVLTRHNRDDQPRAQALCMQFLKLHALTHAGVGLDNPYTNDGVTTLWLSEVSALWPTDDDDPAVLAQLGDQMPRPNLPPPGLQKPRPEIEWTALSIPWLAAGQIESGDRLAGDIMFFKMAQPRAEAEWLRELAHEYGHLWLPPFGTFRPPFEPYANGLVGETLGLTWAAATADFDIAVPARADSNATPLMAMPSAAPLAAMPASAGTASAGATRPAMPMREALLAHVAAHAMPSLRFWNAQGPSSPLQRDAARDGLQYLQGLTVYIERVYGARVLGRAARPLLEQQAAIYETSDRVRAVNAAALLDALQDALANPFESGQKVLPVWLPGAAMTPSSSTATPSDFVARAPLALKAGERLACWLYVPPTAKSLRVEWKSAPPQSGALRVEGGWSGAIAPASLPGAAGALVVTVAARPGWQRFAFAAPADTTILAAGFERAVPAAVPAAPRPNVPPARR